MSIGSHTSPVKGATDHWLSPPDMVNELGPFDTDPCCPDNMPWQTAERMYTEADDGLAQPWVRRVWMNPPYSRNMEFVRKFAEHRNGICLTFARTETAWFKQLYSADLFLFLHGRLHFHLPDGSRARGNAGGPSVLIAYRERNCIALIDYHKKRGGLLLKNL